MKQIKKFILFKYFPVIFYMIVISSCGGPKADTKNLKAKIVYAVSCDSKQIILEDLSKNNVCKYKWKTVPLKNIIDIETLKGSVVSLRAKRNIFVYTMGGDLIKENTDLSSNEKPISLDYYIKQGVVHPKNYSSAMMLSLYYNYQNAYEIWNDKIITKLVTNERYDNEKLGSFFVDYDPIIHFKENNYYIKKTMKANAAFLKTDNFLAYKTSSKTEYIPFKANSFISAHEFGHKVFHLAFANNDDKFYKTSDISLENILRAINEGFADFSGLMVTNSTNMLIDSSNDFIDRVIPVKFSLKDLEAEDSYNICKGGFYCQGSLLTSSLYEISEATNLSYTEIAKILFVATKNFSADWHEANNGKEQMLEDFDYFKYLNRIVEQLPSGSRDVACRIFKNRFNTEKNIIGLEKQCYR